MVTELKFRLFGTEVYISFLFMAVITIMLATDRTGLILPSLFAIIMHEAGHLFAMWLLECAPKQHDLEQSEGRFRCVSCADAEPDS